MGTLVMMVCHIYIKWVQVGSWVPIQLGLSALIQHSLGFDNSKILLAGDTLEVLTKGQPHHMWALTMMNRHFIIMIIKVVRRNNFDKWQLIILLEIPIHQARRLIAAKVDWFLNQMHATMLEQGVSLLDTISHMHGQATTFRRQRTDIRS
jgi:hypothetical protein